MKNIVILTGAGISAESGIQTYRDPDGLWQQHDPMVVSHINGWRAQPQKVLDFKNMLRRQFAEHDYQPNAAHRALARLQREWPGEVTIVTQNIDGLHQRAGATVLDIHGNGQETFCERCDTVSPYEADITLDTPCPGCGATGTTRPRVVLFGEMPLHLELVAMKLRRCHIFAVIGSSLEVAPASNLIYDVPPGTTTYLINAEPVSSVDLGRFHTCIFDTAARAVPQWVDMLLHSNVPA